MCTPCCSDKFEARFLAKLHRRRFERARAAHPWQASAQLARTCERVCVSMTQEEHFSRFSDDVDALFRRRTS